MERLLDPLERKGIILRPEDQHANETRADLTLWAMCNHHAFRMPVEIKCESHSKVWTAWADQLQRYANSPEAAGVGLYLVLWFGLDPRLEVSRRTGTKPASASQLQARLQARVAASNSQGIRVFVLDLSLPEANARKGKNPKKQVRQRA
jgi:hypothetical protein